MFSPSSLKTQVFFFVCLVTASNAFAQTGAEIDVKTMGNSNGYGTVRYDNPSGVGAKQVDIDPADINGSPFFNDKWAPASITLSNGKVVKVVSAKLNLYNNELHFIDSTGRELVADDHNINKVVFADAKDPSKAAATFVVEQGYKGKTGGTYMQSLNDGGIQLLKLNEIQLVKKDYNVTLGKNVYAFQPGVHYLFLKDGYVVPCKGLNKSDIIAAILPDEAAQAWLDTNKNKLKNEKDVLNFLAYYNAPM